MNDSENILFKKAIELSSERSPLPTDFQTKVMARIAYERTRREERADRIMITVSVVLAVIGFVGIFIVATVMGWIDTEWYAGVIGTLRRAFTFDINAYDLGLSAIHPFLIPTAVLLFYGILFLWIDTRLKRKRAN